MPVPLPTPPTRTEAQSAAFEELTEPKQVAGLTLRPFTSFSWDRCVRMNVRSALESYEDIAKMPTAEILRETAMVAWMQSSPPREVAAAFSAGEEAVWIEVEEFECQFNSRPTAGQDWLALVEEVTRTLLRAKALLFTLADTEESKESESGETPPGNS